MKSENGARQGGSYVKTKDGKTSLVARTADLSSAKPAAPAKAIAPVDLSAKSPKPQAAPAADKPKE